MNVLKITSPFQLLSLIRTVQKGDLSVVEALSKFNIKLDLIQFLETDLFIKNERLKNLLVLNFYKESDPENVAVSYYLSENRIVDADGKSFSMEYNESFEYMNEDQFETVSRNFLATSNFDLTHGFYDEDVISLGRQDPTLFNVFFGGSIQSKLVKK